MSSILKALRRLEEERARNSSVAPEIAASLLRRGVRRRPPSPWIWPTVIIAVAAMVMITLWSWRPAPVANQIVPLASSPAAISSAATAGQGGTVIIEEVIDQRRPVLLPPAPTPLLTAQSTESEMITPVQSKPAPLFIEEKQIPIISAIAWQDDSAARMAVVDGLPVMTGEYVGTAKVQEILRDRILFAEGGRFFTIYIDPQ